MLNTFHDNPDNLMEALEPVKQGISGSLEEIIAEIKEETQQHRWEIADAGF